MSGQNSENNTSDLPELICGSGRGRCRGKYLQDNSATDFDDFGVTMGFGRRRGRGFGLAAGRGMGCSGRGRMAGAFGCRRGV